MIDSIEGYTQVKKEDEDVKDNGDSRDEEVIENKKIRRNELQCSGVVVKKAPARRLRKSFPVEKRAWGLQLESLMMMEK